MPREIPDQRFFRLVGIVLAFLTELPSPVANNEVVEDVDELNKCRFWE